MKNKTLKDFLEKNNACRDGYLFAKDLTLEQFLATCDRGDWILWLFVRMNPKHKKLRVLTAAHCANTVRHLMKDERSLKAVDTAIAYGEGRATVEELNIAADAVDAAARAAPPTIKARFAALDAARADAIKAVATAADAAYDAATYTTAYTDGSVNAIRTKKQNQKQTADICRKYLPIDVWNIDKL